MAIPISSFGVAMSGPCFVCGRPHSPFGYGLPGPRSEKPKGKRGYLWACAEHREDAEKRRNKALGIGFGGARRADPPNDPAPQTEKGDK